MPATGAPTQPPVRLEEARCQKLGGHEELSLIIGKNPLAPPATHSTDRKARTESP
jgi:hypothetical protein